MGNYVIAGVGNYVIENPSDLGNFMIADISKHREAIDATLDHRLSNGLVESTNTKIRLLTRVAFGFKSPEAMIALAMLNLGGYCPPLPGREAA